MTATMSNIQLQLQNDFPQFAILSDGEEPSTASDPQLQQLDAALVQAGLMSEAGEDLTPLFFKKIWRAIRPAVKKAIPVVAGAAGTAIGGPLGGTIGAAAGGAASNLLSADEVDMLFLQGFLQGQVADMIRKLNGYVRQYGGLVDVIPQVTEVVRLFSAGEYVKALSKAYACYNLIQQRLAASPN